MDLLDKSTDIKPIDIFWDKNNLVIIDRDQKEYIFDFDTLSCIGERNCEFEKAITNEILFSEPKFQAYYKYEGWFCYSVGRDLRCYLNGELKIKKTLLNNITDIFLSPQNNMIALTLENLHTKIYDISEDFLEIFDIRGEVPFISKEVFVVYNHEDIEIYNRSKEKIYSLKVEGLIDQALIDNFLIYQTFNRKLTFYDLNSERIIREIPNVKNFCLFHNKLVYITFDRIHSMEFLTTPKLLDTTI